MVEVIEEDEGGGEPFFELDRLGMTIAFGTQEDDVDQMVRTVRARRLQDEGHSLGGDLQSSLFRDLPPGCGGTSLSLAGHPTGEDPGTPLIGTSAEQDGVVAKEHH